MSKAHFWFLILIALFAWPAAAYLVRYVRSPGSVDVTSPKPDLSWRSNKSLLIAGGSLTALIGFAVFSFTTSASEFAQSQLFLILLFAGLAGFGIYSIAEAIRTGSIEPAMKGGFGPYDRTEHPKRFWSSLAWNTLLTGLMLWFALMAWNGDF